LRAAEALLARGDSSAVPAMIDAWRKIRPRLPANQSDAYSEASGLITFLAKSGDLRAITALGENIRAMPVEVRLAVARVFLPFPSNGGGMSQDANIYVNADIGTLPVGE